MTSLPSEFALEARTPLEQASLNNAIWCHTVCRAHGVPGEFTGSVWLNRHVPPPYHSNLVTLRGASQAASSLAQVQALLRLALPHRWTVKAGQNELDLASLGFEPLFDADWIWREPDRAAHSVVWPSAWSRVGQAADLATWNRGWSADGNDPNMAGRAPQFPASMLADPGVAFLALHDGERLVGGGIANRTGRVVGLSNAFGEGQTPAAATAPADFWDGLVQAAQAAFPGLALVGYERGASLQAAQAAGFSTIGKLRAWIRHG